MKEGKITSMQSKAIPGGGQIPVIGLGTWEVGGHSSPDYSQDESVIRAWKQALEMGYTHIDTAEMYGGGHTEQLVGKVIQGVDREKLFLTSKVWQTHLSYQGVKGALQGSLKRLGTDYLDLYLIHWPTRGVPLEETFRALNEVVEQGLVRHIGVSNFHLALLEKARELAETPLATDQVPYSVFNRKYQDNGVLAYCQEHGILFTAYTPVEKGKLAQSEALQQIARQHEATAIQVALKWVVAQPGVITIPQSTNVEHLRQNLEAVGVELSPEEMERINQLA